MIRKAALLRVVPVTIRLALVLGVFLLGREVLVRGALTRAGSGARRLGEVSREVMPQPNPSQGLRREAFWWLLAPEADERPGPAGAKEDVPSGRSPASSWKLGPEPTPVVTLPSAVVLGLAERGAMPRGRAVPAAHDLPAGIEILDGNALGIGWYPGDRLVLVDGVPVTDRAEVVRHVLAGRAQRAPLITATLARRTKAGVVTYRVLVEQPYLLEEPEAVVPVGPPAGETPGPP